MIAYKKIGLDNLLVQNQCLQALDWDCIQEPEFSNIKTAYPVTFYTPHFFIRVGLFLLTIIIGIFSFGLVGLLFMDAIEKSFAGLIIFFGLAAYGFLEMIVHNKNHYRSGVTEALIWVSAGAVFGGISYASDANGLANSILLFFISAYFVVRFSDILSSIVAFLSLMGILFFTCVEMGIWGKALAPFVIMAGATTCYFLVSKFQKQEGFKYYAECLFVVEIAALLTVYVAGNYFVVRELSISMFDLQLAEGASIPFGWLFWIFTVAIPLLYLGFGLLKKDAVLIRVGLVLVAVIVFTLKYYYSVAPIEILMSISGIALIAVSWFLIRYLKQPKQGFTYETIAGHESFVAKQLEAIIIAETFTSLPSTEPSTQFGGGSFGGAGAGSDF